MISLGIFLIISKMYLLLIIIVPVFSMLVINLLSINVSTVSSLSLAINVKPSFFNSNLIPFNTGITFFVDIPFTTLFKFSNNKLFSIANFIKSPLSFLLYNIY